MNNKKQRSKAKVSKRRHYVHTICKVVEDGQPYLVSSKLLTHIKKSYGSSVKAFLEVLLANMRRCNKEYATDPDYINLQQQL